MTILVNGQKITTPKVCVLPDMFDTSIILEDGSGVFYEGKCNKDTVITIHENLTGWEDISSIKENMNVPTKTDAGLQFRFDK